MPTLLVILGKRTKNSDALEGTETPVSHGYVSVVVVVVLRRECDFLTLRFFFFSLSLFFFFFFFFFSFFRQFYSV